jgi:hypothetical protein
VGHPHHFPRGKQNFTHTRCSLRSAYSVFFKKIGKPTCRHLDIMSEKLKRSTHRKVTWQASSEYLRLTVPSGRNLKYVSFVRKIQIPEIFGSPSYTILHYIFVLEFKHLCSNVCLEATSTPSITYYLFILQYFPAYSSQLQRVN